MQYRSIADMNDAIVRNLYKLPSGIDLVVGVPRSGLLAANLLSLVANIPLTDLDSFLDGRMYSSGTSSKRAARLDRGFGEMRRILVLDDSIKSGDAMRRARERIAKAGIEAELIFAAIYGLESSHPDVDVIFEKVENPRLFQWNFMHHVVLEKACVDIDGVLCRDPTKQENDDGEAYRRFIAEAVPLLTTSRKIGWLVTSRLEKYRGLTEEWLRRQGIQYGELVMLDLPSKEERQRQRAHGSFKAEFYKRSTGTLFIESEHRQAETIAQISGKPVLCVETHQVYLPDPMTPAAMQQQFRNLPSRFKQTRRSTGAAFKGMARDVLGDRAFMALKAIMRPQS
ncbi:phosphoribosyltransferase family protein [Sphingomonas panaciterrae]|uniref:phosphoribosyltransferase family protein n=1 Tax=Sphingomonas panaciterrae TaxID=1462999 RepID=UPI002FF26345